MLSNALKSSIVMLKVFLFVFAIFCKTLKASSSLPLLRRYFGDSWKVKMTNRIMNTNKDIPPSVYKRYLHPLLSSLAQHSAPGAKSVALHDRRFVAQEYLGISP